ncbi:hypothetical protein A0H76_2244 [Hepatospora eriocheir]|uniref:Uncharacterized protein n=1 Tax=Hepatospora eriocheir TaxID=1081669 RepID=A0A1X0QK42_9MICR|nr:hypothetical protein A0H76_2244 [Hepatospora eriocheir]
MEILKPFVKVVLSSEIDICNEITIYDTEFPNLNLNIDNSQYESREELSGLNLFSELNNSMNVETQLIYPENIEFDFINSTEIDHISEQQNSNILNNENQQNHMFQLREENKAKGKKTFQSKSDESKSIYKVEEVQNSQCYFKCLIRGSKIYRNDIIVSEHIKNFFICSEEKDENFKKSVCFFIEKLNMFNYILTKCNNDKNKSVVKVKNKKQHIIKPFPENERELFNDHVEILAFYCESLALYTYLPKGDFLLKKTRILTYIFKKAKFLDINLFKILNDNNKNNEIFRKNNTRLIFIKFLDRFIGDVLKLDLTSFYLTLSRYIISNINKKGIENLPDSLIIIIEEINEKISEKYKKINLNLNRKKLLYKKFYDAAIDLFYPIENDFIDKCGCLNKS